MSYSFAKISIILFFSFTPAVVLSQPPATPRIPVTDNYFGMQVTDFYRWMENTNDSITLKWFQEQDAYTESMFDKISGRDQLLAEYNKLDSVQGDIYWNVKKDGEVYIFLKQVALEDKIYLLRRIGESGKDEIIIDFKKQFPDKPRAVLFFEYSPVSKILTFHFREGNHEGTTIFFYDLVKEEFFPEQIRYSFGGWPYKTKFDKEGKGFFYYTITVENNKAMLKNSVAKYHRIGSSPESDIVLASKEKYPSLFPGFHEGSNVEVTVDPDFIYLILACGNGEGDYVFMARYSELANERINWNLISKPDDKLEQPIIRNGIAYFLSKDVPNQRIKMCRLGDLTKPTFEIFIPEKEQKLDHLSVSKDFLFLRYTSGTANSFQQYNIKTGELEVALTTEQGIYRPARISETSNEIEFTVANWTKPPATYFYDPEKKIMRKSVFGNSIVYPDTDDLVSQEVEIPGHDGVMIPLSLIYHKKTNMDGNAICILDGYGAYGSVTNPGFSQGRLILCKKGVVFAYAHVRGGGEKGEPWRLAGFKSTKPNTWKDFISCAEWLINNKYTSTTHLIAHGASAGGITVGRAVTERPDLFAVVINRVGTTNVLRIDQLPGGNTAEFGTVNDSLESRYLYEMDATHHVKKVNYPAVLSIAGMTDGRVPVWQPGKFAAALQYFSTSAKPTLLQVYFKGGHFGESGKSRNTNISNEMAFALWQAGHPDFRLKE